MMAFIEKSGVFDVLQNPEIKGILPGKVTGVACDSRKVRAGYIFVAFRGSRRDGRDYISDAVSRGAAAIVSDSPVNAPVCVVIVKDAHEALARLCAVFYDNPSSRMFVAGITGTNGKTTTAYIAREFLLRAGRETGLIGTVEYCIGNRAIPAERTTPEAPVLQQLLANMVKAGCDSAVMEVSSHALVQKRVSAIDYDVGVLTNLARDHLDYHGDRDAYAAAKARLFYGLAPESCAILNIDDKLGAALVSDSSVVSRKITYGSADDADYRIGLIAPEFDGTSFQLCANGKTLDLRTNMMGRFNVYNIVAAMALAEQAGLDLEKMAGMLSQLPVIPGRLEEVPNDRGIKIIVDYAHTDDALEKILVALGEAGKGRLLLVFGCGGNRDRTKRPAMGQVAAKMADFSVVTSDNPRGEDPLSIIREIEAGFSDKDSYVVKPDRTDAIRTALELARKGDVLVIAGKGHENFQEFANTTVSFDDRMVVKRILEEM